MSNDEVLSVSDVLGLRLPAVRLAFLSACESGIPGREMPDESISLAAGALSAGIQRVASTSWAVTQISTLLIAIRFYELWQTKHTAPAEALRQAQIWLRETTNREKVHDLCNCKPTRQIPHEVLDTISTSLESRRDGKKAFSHPYYWAGFSFSGLTHD
jgi:CHAT domain-containing protein